MTRALAVFCVECGGWLSVSTTDENGPAVETRGDLLVIRLEAVDHVSTLLTTTDITGGPCSCIRPPPPDVDLQREERDTADREHAAFLAARTTSTKDFP